MVDIVPHSDIDNEEGQGSKRRKTAGEVVFDRGVYTGIGFGVNELMSLWITDQFLHGKPILGWKGFSKQGFEWLSEKAATVFKLKERFDYKARKISPKARAGNSILMATLLSGGTLLVLPMKLIEDSRIWWVTKLNHFIDRVSGNQLSPDAEKARDTEVEQAIACMPRQSWPSMLAGRVIAMFSSWATGTFLMGPERNDRVMDGVEHGIAGVIEGASKIRGGNGDTFLGRVSQRMQERKLNAKGERDLDNLNAWQRYARLIGVETYSCALSSVVLEIASKLMSGRNKSRVHDPELCNELKNGKAEASANNNGNKSDTDGRADVGRHAKKEAAPVSHVEKTQSCRNCPTQPSL